MLKVKKSVKTELIKGVMKKKRRRKLKKGEKLKKKEGEQLL